jgi:NAD(P)-dependent dehydrogenase (short-subunit alcohol dehydrogenase family)
MPLGFERSAAWLGANGNGRALGEDRGGTARHQQPREVAQVIAFLCNDAAGGVNGETVTVALGGMW